MFTSSLTPLTLPPQSAVSGHPYAILISNHGNCRANPVYRQHGTLLLYQYMAHAVYGVYCLSLAHTLNRFSGFLLCAPAPTLVFSKIYRISPASLLPFLVERSGSNTPHSDKGRLPSIAGMAHLISVASVASSDFISELFCLAQWLICILQILTYWNCTTKSTSTNTNCLFL